MKTIKCKVSDRLLREIEARLKKHRFPVLLQYSIPCYNSNGEMEYIVDMDCDDDFDVGKELLEPAAHELRGEQVNDYEIFCP